MSLQTVIVVALQGSVFLSVIALALNASAADALHLFRQPAKLLRSVIAMNVAMPAFATVIGLAFDLQPAIKVALILFSVSPVPPLLAKKQIKQGGSETYAIGLLVTAALLSVVLIPVAVSITERFVAFDAVVPIGKVAMVVFLTVLAPLGIGFAVRTYFPESAKVIAEPLGTGASVALICAIVPVLITQSQAIIALLGNGTLVAFIAFVVVGLAAGHILGGPVPEDRTVLALATASRHPGVATAIAAANFPNRPAVTAIVLLYVLVGVAIAIPYGMWHRPHEARKVGLSGKGTFHPKAH